MELPRSDEALSDAPENANEEYGHGDQEFGGGPGEMEYGEEKVRVGADGVVADVDFARTHQKLTTDDEREGIALPGTDDEDLVTAEAEAEAASEDE